MISIANIVINDGNIILVFLEAVEYFLYNPVAIEYEEYDKDDADVKRKVT